MAEPRETVDRSFEMLVASYYLARCGQPNPGGPSGPPSRLGVTSWKDAYDVFFEAMGDGRTPAQFRNSMKNARDTFDVLFPNGRIGWVGTNGSRPSMPRSFQRVDEEWQPRTDAELEGFIFRLITGSPEAGPDQLVGAVARTEGGTKVFLSKRIERDDRAKRDAVTIHGLSCVACGFNFEKVYGAWGRGFIEVHHIVPLAQSGRTETDPKTDLAVLCANCHRMVHRRQGICLTVAELRSHIRKAE
jgi:5-methylcytosine-specific restriction protein A